jgi:hypothetical protein
MKRALLFALAAASLALTACGGSTVGRACAKTSECEPGQTCYSSAPNGMCTKGCSMEATAKDCPGGTVCTTSLGLLLCSTVCSNSDMCRTGYHCVPVIGSTQSACVPQ